jgi:hypothetical protein
MSQTANARPLAWSSRWPDSADDRSGRSRMGQLSSAYLLVALAIS